MGYSSELAMEQEEQRNDMGHDEYEQWCSENDGMFLCPYCGKVSLVLKPCCGELHSREIVYVPAKQMCENNHKILNQFTNLITLEK